MLRCGLIGRAIAASRSPWLHEQEARAQGIDLRYELFDFDQPGGTDSNVRTLLRRLADEGYCGVNITFPFKQAVIPLLDDVAPSAAMVGAVNTVEMRHGRLIGHNTDMAGFRESVAEGLPGVSLASVLQLGAGGAGSAVANALVELGVGQLLVCDVDLARAELLAAQVNSRLPEERVTAISIASLDAFRVDGIVNTTPMGMAANPAPAISPDLLDPRHWVADIVYFPLETELLRLARACGCRTLDGSGMAIGQAALAFEIFTGAAADRKRMRKSFTGPGTSPVRRSANPND